jgi:hypothetical protein
MSAIVKGPNPLLRIGHNIIVIGRKRSRPKNITKRPRNIIKVFITTQKKKSALPVRGHFHMCQSCINKEANASLRHTLTYSLRDKSRSYSWRRERERSASLREDFMYLFKLSLGIVLAIYIKEVLLGFLPHEGFPG